MEIQELKKKCTDVRRDIINMTADAASGHPGGSLSAVELMAGLFWGPMRVDPQSPQDENRDRFVLSKGHAAPCYYAILGEMGYFDPQEFKNFRQLHSILQGHPDAKKTPGVDASTGSLGQGVSIATGMALAAKAQKKDINVYALLGDGELQEGQVWEACMAAAHYQLDNLTIMIDNNGLQIDGSNDEVMGLGNLNEKFGAFGFRVVEVADGNCLEEVLAAYAKEPVPGKPNCIIAHTVKGKGISFMENRVGWHGKAPNAEERKLALAELEEA
ncbi:MAG: transketolase [Lachnospiraceae bacterium]